MTDPFTVRWYPIVNDLVGGWSIATADVPLREIDTRNRDVAVVGDFLTEGIARHIVALHNAAITEGATR